jgi:hypothetical protein
VNKGQEEGPRRLDPGPPKPSGAILAALVEPHPPPRLHRCRLHRRVGDLQPVPQGVVGGIGEVGVGLALEGGYLGRGLGLCP